MRLMAASSIVLLSFGCGNIGILVRAQVCEPSWMRGSTRCLLQAARREAFTVEGKSPKCPSASDPERH